MFFSLARRLTLIFSVLFIAQAVYLIFNNRYLSESNKVFVGLSFEGGWTNPFFTNLVLHVGGYWLCHLMLGLCAAFVLTGIAEAFAYRFKTSGLVLASLSLYLGVLTLNSYYYPHSSFASTTYLSPWIFCIHLVTLLVILTGIVLLFRRYINVKYMLVLSLIPIVLWSWHKQPLQDTSTYQGTLPNIFIIGFDSLRQDYIDEQTMPNLHRFLAQTQQFEQSYTPLARTYGAWLSILTGQHPQTHGGRFNLIDESQLSPTLRTLPQQLQEVGYETVYATDERSFSNITERYGFHEIIGPKTGALEFVLAKYGDLPLVNLLAGFSRLSPFFPYHYANRAAHWHYKPEAFTQQLQQYLSKPKQSPLFMATHFCLPHWPFTYAKSSPLSFGSDTSRYLESLQAVDQQFLHLREMLAQESLLENTIFVVLADHGETLLDELQRGEVLQAFPQMQVNQWGHGSSVLTRNQHQVLLAWQLPHEKRATKLKQIASLIDVTPTIYEFLHLPKSSTFDGISLLPWLQNSSQAAVARTLIFESGLKVPAVTTEQTLADIVQKYGEYYHVNASGDVRLNNFQLGRLTAEKQRAVLMGDTVFALIPSGSESFLLGVDYAKNAWYKGAELRQDNTFLALQKKLCNFYHAELVDTDISAC